MLIRLVAVLGLVFSILVLPWVASLFLALMAVIYWESFYEAAGVAFLYDLLYGLPGSTVFGFQFITTVFALVLIFFVNELRRSVSFSF